MARKGEDPMSGLLSDVGGIDSSLFQKPQPMRDMRSHISPVKARADNWANPSSQRPTGATAVAPSPAHPVKADSQPQQRRAASAGAGGVKSPSDSNRQLDALLGGGVLSKASRPMRESNKAPLQTPQASISPTYVATSSRGPTGADAHDDLETVFGTAAGRRQDLPAHDSGDPFSLFGGLGTTETARDPSPARGEGAGTSLLGDAVSRSSRSWTGSVPSRSRVEQAGSPERRSVHSGSGDSADWGGMMAATSGLSSPLSSSAVLEDAFDTFALSSPQPRGRESPQAASASPDRAKAPPPPVRSQPLSGEAAQRSRGVASPRSRLASHGSGRYQIYRDGDADGDALGSPQQSAGGRHHRRTSSSEKAQQKARQQAPQQEQIKDQAKQWLSAGQKWLSGAGKKVAQAVKETQAQLNSKLEEFEAGRQGDGSGSTRAQPPRPSQAAATAQPAQSLDDIPAYYFDWARTIEGLPGREQGSALAAMPEEDAATIQRILRHSARRRSMDDAEGAMLAEAQRRSLSDAEPAQRESTASPGPTPRRSRSNELHASPTPAPGTGRSRPAEHRPARPLSASAERLSSPQRQSLSPTKPKAQQNANLFDVGPPVEARARDMSPPPAVDGQNDLMGIHSSAAEPQAAPAPVQHDLMGGPAPSGGDSGLDLENIFAAPPAKAGRASAPSRDVPPELQELFGTRQPPAGTSSQAGQRAGVTNGGSMIDFGDGIAAGHEELYEAGLMDQEQEGEPEARKVARRRRLAEMHARMQRQLAEKQARDQAESRQQEQQHDLRAHHRERIEAWKSGKKDNIRALLSTLHTVLWENSGWTAPQMTDLVEVSRVKRCYMKANLVVHPDKVKQKGGSVEQIVVADMAFDTLKTAWAKFETGELRSR